MKPTDNKTLTKEVLDQTEVLIPWFGNDPVRTNGLLTVARLWGSARLPVRLAECPSAGFRKGLALWLAAERSRASWLILSDADVWCPGWDVALAEVVAGADWAMPHTNVHRLTEKATAFRYNIKTIEELNLHESDYIELPYPGTVGGGMVIIPRETFLSYPMDGRFIGWGCEDTSWGYALEVILPNWFKGESDLIHLWHEPADRPSRKRGNDANESLRHRYQMSTIGPETMKEIVEEGRQWLIRESKSNLTLLESEHS